MFNLFGTKETKEPWRGGVFLTTAHDSFEADMLVSKLQAEGIPSEKKYVGASNFLEISMGSSSAYPIEIYVPESALEQAREVIVPVPIDDDFEEASEDSNE
ncbi:MAG: DUF2007 domain-containing protein [Clostridia bacterium]|nr:DUF2007 domain-containing protein [Clostridia bacterium]